MDKIQYILIHHSLTKDNEVPDWDAIRRYHMEVNGWRDVGYDFGLERQSGDLVVRTGRPLTISGAHTVGFNNNSVGIMVCGNYDLYPPEEDKLDLLELLVRGLMSKYGITSDKVIGHGEANKMIGNYFKSCPGSMFSMPDFRLRLP